MPGNIVRLIFTGDNASVLRAQREIAGESEVTGKVLRGENDETIASNEETAGSFDTMRGSVGLLAGALGLGALAYGIKDVIQGGEKWQAQQIQLQAVLKSTGNYSKSAVADINASATALSTHGGFSTPSQIAAITQFIGITHKSSEALKLNKAATDLARTGLVSYTTAVSDIAASANGSSRGLQKLIGTIVPYTGAVFGYNAAMRETNPLEYARLVALDHAKTLMEVNTRILQEYGKATDKYNHSVAGMTSNLLNTVDNIITKLELHLLPDVEKLLMGMMAVVNWVVHNWPTISKVIAATFSPVTFLIHLLGGVRNTVLLIGAGLTAWAASIAVIRGLAAATAIWETAMLGLQMYESLVAAETGVLAAGFMSLAAALDINPWVLGFTLLALAITVVITHISFFKKIFNDVITWISQNWKLLVGIILLPFIGPIALIIAKFNDLKKIVTGIVNWIVGAFHSVEHFLGIGTHLTVAHQHQLNVLAHNVGRQVGPAPASLTRYNPSVVRSTDTVPANSHRAGDTIHHQPIVIKVGAKVIAQTAVLVAQRETALSR